jgi:hypothetical protein
MMTEMRYVRWNVYPGTASTAATLDAASAGGRAGGMGRPVHHKFEVLASKATVRNDKGIQRVGSVSAQEKRTPDNLYVRKQGKDDKFKDRLHPCDERDLHAALGVLVARDQTKTKLPDGWKAPFIARGSCEEGPSCPACAKTSKKQE